MSCAKKVCVFQAGFAAQLIKYTKTIADGDELYTSRFNFTHPEAVIQAHLDFLREGAEIILTNTYQSSNEGHKKCLGLNEAESLELIRKTVRFAHTARDTFLKETKTTEIPLIAAAIGPYGAALHDGSEYTGSYANKVSTETMREWHRPRIAACVEAGVDFLGFFTIPCLIEAIVLVDFICTEYPNMKFWISFQCKDELHLANGDKFSDAALSIWNQVKKHKSDQLLAVGINCLHPSYTVSLLKSANSRLGNNDRIPWMVMPTSGERYDDKLGWHGDKEQLDTFVSDWIKQGAKYIGGCCRTNISDIQLFKKAVNACV